MTLAKMFVEKALNCEENFDIEYGPGPVNYHFLQDRVGKARYIYGVSRWNDKKFYSDTGLTFDLIAIVSDGIVYIVGHFFLNIYNNTYLPEKAKLFENFMKGTNEYISNVIFTKFYEQIPVRNITENLEGYRTQARKYLLSKDPVTLLEGESIADLFKEKDIANILCGFLDIETKTYNMLEEAKEKWIDIKTKNEKIRSLMNDPETALGWELKIVEGLRSVDAKTVTVEFELDGRRASEKICPENILDTLRDKAVFSDYDFEVTKKGEKLFEKLGIEDQNAKELKCENIYRITYGKKELYVRE